MDPDKVGPVANRTNPDSGYPTDDNDGSDRGDRTNRHWDVFDTPDVTGMPVAFGGDSREPGSTQLVGSADESAPHRRTRPPSISKIARTTMSVRSCWKPNGSTLWLAVKQPRRAGVRWSRLRRDDSESVRAILDTIRSAPEMFDAKTAESQARLPAMLDTIMRS